MNQDKMLSKGYIGGGNGLNHYPSNNLSTLFRDWREHPQISDYRSFIRNEMVEILESETTCQWRQQGYSLVCAFETQLFKESASMEEYINLDTLRLRLNLLIIQWSTHVPRPTMALTYGCNSHAADPPFNRFNCDSSEFSPTVIDKTDQFDVQKAAAGMDITSTVGTRQVASGIGLSPEMGSTITTCSNGEGITEIGALDSGPVFSQGHCLYSFKAPLKDDFLQQHPDHSVRNDQNLHAMAFPSMVRESSEFPNSNFQIPEHIPGMNSEMSPIFSGMNSGLFENLLQSKSQTLEQSPQLPCQTYWQFNKPMDIKTPCNFTEQNDFCHAMTGQAVPTHSQLPSEQLAGSHVASESSVPFCSSKGTPTPPYSNCTGHVRKFSDICSGGYGSCCSENMLPQKRLKMENFVCSISSENGIASVLAPLTIQPCYPEGLPPLQQWPESPASINSEFLKLNGELSDPMKNPMSIDLITSNVADDYARLNSQSMSTPSDELTVGCKSEGSRSFSEIANIMEDDSNPLRFGSMHVPSGEHGAGFKEKVIQVISISEVDKPEIENELNAPEVEHKKEMKPKNLDKLEIENELNAPRVEHKKEMKPKDPEIGGVSLIEYFTTEQIKEHISSLRQWTGQSISTKEKGKKIMNNINENTCQLCAKEKLFLAPVPIYCSCCGLRIKYGVNYYSTSEENFVQPCFCSSCYRGSRGGRIKFYENSIPKAQLVTRKNDETAEEPWVECDKCKQWQHQICALFNDKRDMEGKAEYICPRCCLENIESRKCVPLSKNTVFAAKDLPSTMLSDYIEQRLFRRLKQEREERAKVDGMNPDKVPGAEDLVVRVVLSVNKQLKVKKQFLDLFHGENYPPEFPYRSKVILLFQKIEGVDVCLFGMYVQEFGTECSHPNQRCVYISYLDSVKYFRPERETAVGEALRTFVYHEILIGYLENCKKRGFATCYLWACPPVKGEDYILYCHPENQKTPKSDKLRQWYHSMLRKAAKENVVVDFTNLYDKFFVPNGQCYSKITAARLPYFDGCYWSDAAENVIENIEQHSGKYSGRKVTKLMTKRTLKAMGHTNPSDGATKDILLMQKLGQTILPFKEDFIVVHLQFVCTHCHEVILSGWRWFCSQCKNFQLCERCHDAEQSLNEEDIHILNSKEKHLLSKVMVNDVPSDTTDEDVILDNGLFGNRHSFLIFFQKNHYQFDTLRRAKHSSMMILHHLHNPTVPTGETTCKICHQDVDTKDRDVCSACCHKKDGSLRIHKLKQCSSAAYDGTESKNAQKKPILQKELLDLLQHASQCQANIIDPCSYPNCLLIKNMFRHAKECTIRVRGGCLYCKKVWYMLRLHSRICRQTDCSVPRCKDLRAFHASDGGKYLRSSLLRATDYQRCTDEQACQHH